MSFPSYSLSAVLSTLAIIMLFLLLYGGARLAKYCAGTWYLYSLTYVSAGFIVLSGRRPEAYLMTFALVSSLSVPKSKST